MFPRTAAAAGRTIGANDRITARPHRQRRAGHPRLRSVACGADNVVCVALCDVAEFRLDRSDRGPHRDDGGQGPQGRQDRPLWRLPPAAGPQGHRRGDHRHARPLAPPAVHRRLSRPASTSTRRSRSSFTIEQGMEMVAAAKKQPDLTIQIGTQRRSDTNNAKAKELIDKRRDRQDQVRPGQRLPQLHQRAGPVRPAEGRGRQGSTGTSSRSPATTRSRTTRGGTSPGGGSGITPAAW